MIGSLSLPAIAFLAAITGLPGIPGLKGLPTPQSKEYARAKAEAVAADTLALPWKPSWRLALEDRFIYGGLFPIGQPYGPIRLSPTFDPRKVVVTMDPDSGIYQSAVEVGDVPLGPGFRRPLSLFAHELSMRSLHDHWLDKSRQNINTLGTDTPVQRTGISLPIPVRLPGRMASWLGPGGPALNVSGSESIRLSGTSNWTNQKLQLLGQRQSLFPSLDMQQDLDIRLEGQLSDRVKVNLLQNSANQVPLANRIAINYRGDEDDFIQALDLGNTSLSLPGTQYVSYSGKNEGLFGVKLASRIGPLDFTTLASKQEGRSERAVYSGGGASVGSNKFNDLDWVKGQYFLLYDPNLPAIYDIKQNDINLYLDEANGSVHQGTFAGKAFIDPQNSLNMNLPPAQAAAGVPGSFRLLKQGDDGDYVILNDVYAFHDTVYKVIRLKQPIQAQSQFTLAVTYNATPLRSGGPPIQVGGQTQPTSVPGTPDTLIMKLLRAPYDLQTSADNRHFDPTATFAIVKELELKNFYNLGGYGIDPKSFKLTLQKGQDDPPTTSLADGTPFIEVVGLDSWNEQTTPQRGHDGQVDAITFPTATTRAGWVDFVNGVLFLPDPRPFAPRLTGANQKPFDVFIDGQIPGRRHRLDRTEADSLNQPHPDTYDLRVPQINDAAWYFNAEYAATRTGGSNITLGRSNILEGSEAVVVNGERWQRDRDYTIDYSLGLITLKRQLGSTDQLSVDYSYAPLFAQASKTLVGSAFRFEGRDKSVGGAFLYESKGAQDLRPRLGEEPSRTLITDLNTEWHFKPEFLTRLADALPGVRTTTPSEFNVQAEGGMSFPNPNTRNEVFVDDMEGVRDAVSLAMTPDRWRWSSVPSRASSIVGGSALGSRSFYNDLPRQKNVEVHWFTPVNTRGNTTDNELVHERDLRPKLPDAQGAQNVRTVLGISIPRKPQDPNDFTPGDTLWAGLTYNLDANGIDLSRSQFIELWVDDWNDHHDPTDPRREPRIRGDGTPGSSVKLHIDLGRVSEDQMRAPNRPPNGVKDTEDRGANPDGVLTVTGDNSEDTGIDGLDDAQEQAAHAANSLPFADLSTTTTSDPEGDDWGNIDESFASAVDPRRYRHTNGTEGNHTAYPIPDTEDLNNNNRLDTSESYFEYTIDLGDESSPYLATDVLRDYPGSVVSDTTKNGWRRYRIPLTDSLRVRFGSPDLTITQHVRVWLEGLREDEDTGAPSERPMLMLGGLDIVGSRWQAADLTPRQRDTLLTTVTLNSENTVDNAEEYLAPFDPGTTRNGSQAFQRREQSLALEFTDLFPADTLEAFKTFTLPEDYSRYGVLRWFAASFEVKKRDLQGNDLGSYDPARDSLFYFVRFASDNSGLSYYELKRRLPPSSAALDIHWEEVLADIAKISQAKLDPAYNANRNEFHTVLANGDSLVLVGSPSFTRLLRISIGLLNESGGERFTGRLWFDELRATNVAKDVGLADRLLVNGKWANLMDYNVAYNSRDADFLSVGESRGSGSRTSNLAVSTRFEPSRFFEGTGIQLPVTFSQNQNTQRPRFTAGDDIVRTGVFATQSETRNVSRSMSASYSRVWGDRSNPFLRYTLGGLNGSINRSTSDSRGPTSQSHLTNVAGSVNYQLTPRELLPVPLPFTKARLFPLPERLYWNYGMSQTTSSAFSNTFGSQVLVPSSSQNGRSANIDFGADTRPFDLLSHHIEGHRNLSLGGVRLDRLGFVNLGRLTSWRQSLSTHLAMTSGQWLRPAFNWTSNYNQNNDIQSPDLTARSIGNGQEFSMNWDLPFDRLTGPAVGMQRPAAPPDTSHGAAHPSKRHGPRLPWRDLLARLGAVGTDARVGRNSNYSRLAGNATPLYLIGLAENPGFDRGRVIPLAGNTSGSGVDWRTNAHTTIPLAFGSSLVSRFSYGDRTNNGNGVKSRATDWRFPDFEVNYGRLANILGLARFLDGPQLRTAYARSYSIDYQNSRSIQNGNSRSDDFRPLFALRGRFHNGTDADFRLERRSSVRDAFQGTPSRQTDETTNLNFTLTRSYSQGQKVNLLGRTSTVKTSVNLSLATVYERQTGGIKIGNDSEISNPIDRTRLSVNGTGSYGFSSNVTGDLALGFSHFRETNGIVRRSIRVELRGQFRF